MSILLRYALGFSLLSTPVLGFAADEGQPATAAGALEEIIVTAQRRTERLQDVPISVSVMSQAAMDAQGTRSIDDVARLTPSVSYVRGAVNNNFESSNISIRGIDSSAGAATTGLYLDDTPIQSRHLSFGTFNAYPDQDGNSSFRPDPYTDYSAPWFGTHKVLRGGSFATRARMKNPNYRNFYLPERDDMFCGFRSCAI